MAKIQRLSISTDQKMAMLRAQPGHMPTPAVAADETSVEAATVPSAEPAAIETQIAAEISPAAALEVAPARSVSSGGPASLLAPRNEPVAAPARKGPGRPRKADAQSAVLTPAPATTTGLPPSLIRLEGGAQFAALSYVREEMLRGRRVYLKQLVDEAILYYLEHGPPATRR